MKSESSKTWIVSRHIGAIEYMRNAGFKGQVVSHINIDDVRPNDLVVGVVSIALAAVLQAKGVRVCHLIIDIPVHLRGQELDVNTLQQLDAKFAYYAISMVKHHGG